LAKEIKLLLDSFLTRQKNAGNRTPGKLNPIQSGVQRAGNSGGKLGLRLEEKEGVFAQLGGGDIVRDSPPKNWTEWPRRIVLLEGGGVTG